MAENITGYAAVNTQLGPRNGNTDNLRGTRTTMHDMVGMTAENARALLEEIGELRARLSPLLFEGERVSEEKSLTPPAASKVSAEIADIHTTIRNARDLVRATISQLDL